MHDRGKDDTYPEAFDMITICSTLELGTIKEEFNNRIFVEQSEINMNAR